MRTTQTLDLNARTIIDAGIAEAERIGNPMNIAVVMMPLAVEVADGSAESQATA